MPRPSKLVNGIDGEVIPELKGIEEMHSVDALHRLLDVVASSEARQELRRLIGRVCAGLVPRVYAYAVRSQERPYAVDASDNDRPWKRHGDLYLYCLEGQWVTEDSLGPVAEESQKNALLVLCCFAA